MPTPLLICEGRCNPTLKVVDEQILRWRTKHAGANWGPITDDRLLAAIQRLVHTPHGEVSAGVFGCLLCATTRQWGGRA